MKSSFLRTFFQKRKKGFTLVELIVVIAIVAVLTAVSIAGYYGFLAYSNQSAADQEAAQFKKAIMGQMSASYKGKTASIASSVGVMNSKGVRIYSDVGAAHPEANSLFLLGEAYTYVEAPSTYYKSTFTVENDSIIICDGNKTDGLRPAIYSAKILEENVGESINYYITSVVYQSKTGYESEVKFGDSEGAYELVVSSVNPLSKPTGIQIVGGLKEIYYANEVIDTSNIKALVTFENGSAVVGSESLDIKIVPVTSPAHHTQSGIVKNVAAQARKVVVTYINAKGESVDNSTSNPTVIESNTTIDVEQKDIVVSKPANLLESERIKNIDPNKKAGFFRGETNQEKLEFKYHFVGTANPFIFEPQVSVIENGKKINIIPEEGKISHELYKINIDEEFNEGLEEHLDNSGNTYFTFINANEIQFTNECNGFYKLVTTVYNKTFETKLRIIKGYNAYTLDDLKLFDNTNRLNASNAGNAEIASAGSDGELNMRYISPYITYDETTHKATQILAERFTNHVTDESSSNAADEGLILQNNIIVTANGFDSHIYNSKGDIILNEEFDVLTCFFKRNIKGNQKFVFEGNYFNVDISKMPLKEYRLFGDIKASTFKQPYLFAFAYDYKAEWSASIDENGFERYKEAAFNRVNIVGNAPKSDKDVFQGGYKLINIFNMTKFSSKYVNARAGYFMYEFSANSCGGEVSYCKGYDCWNAIIDILGGGLTTYNARQFYYGNTLNLNVIENLDKNVVPANVMQAINGKNPKAFYEALHQGLYIDHCEFKNCGGPAILKQVWSANTSNIYMPTMDITNSTIESIVNGGEAWFEAMGVKPIVQSYILPILQNVESHSSTHKLIDNGYFNFVTVEITGNDADLGYETDSKFVGNDMLLPDYPRLNSNSDKHGVVGYDINSVIKTCGGLGENFVERMCADATDMIKEDYDGSGFVNKELNQVEAQTYTSINHRKYYNIDHTTYAMMATHGLDIITDSGILLPDGYYYMNQFAPQISLTDMSLDFANLAQEAILGQAPSYPYIMDQKNKGDEIFINSEQYVGIASNALGKGMILGLFNK